jgi:hypothetical protein
LATNCRLPIKDCVDEGGDEGDDEVGDDQLTPDKQSLLREEATPNPRSGTTRKRKSGGNMEEARKGRGKKQKRTEGKSAGRRRLLVPAKRVRHTGETPNSNCKRKPAQSTAGATLHTQVCKQRKVGTTSRRQTKTRKPRARPRMEKCWRLFKADPTHFYKLQRSGKTKNMYAVLQLSSASVTDRKCFGRFLKELRASTTFSDGMK